MWFLRLCIIRTWKISILNKMEFWYNDSMESLLSTKTEQRRTQITNDSSSRMNTRQNKRDRTRTDPLRSRMQGAEGSVCFVWHASIGWKREFHAYITFWFLKKAYDKILEVGGKKVSVVDNEIMWGNERINNTISFYNGTKMKGRGKRRRSSSSGKA